MAVLAVVVVVGSDGGMVPGLVPGVVSPRVAIFSTAVWTPYGVAAARFAPPLPSQNDAASTAAACVAASGRVATL